MNHAPIIVKMTVAVSCSLVVMGNYYLSVIKYSAGVKSTQVPVFAKQHPFISSPFYWAGFGAQRKRAQQDFKVPYKVPH